MKRELIREVDLFRAGGLLERGAYLRSGPIRARGLLELGAYLRSGPIREGAY